MVKKTTGFVYKINYKIKPTPKQRKQEKPRKAWIRAKSETEAKNKFMKAPHKYVGGFLNELREPVKKQGVTFLSAERNKETFNIIEKGITIDMNDWWDSALNGCGPMGGPLPRPPAAPSGQDYWFFKIGSKKYSYLTTPQGDNQWGAVKKYAIELALKAGIKRIKLLTR